MELLRPSVDPQRFLDGLGHAPSRVLMLDYDGTLAPFRVERDEAVPYPGVREAVRRILANGRTRVVVVSGRTVDDLRPLLGIDPPPELWGTHGWERQPPGRPVERRDPGPAATEALRRAREVADTPEHRGRVEVKPASVAFHLRGLDSERAARTANDIRERWAELASDGAVEVHVFDGGLELRVPGRDKGTAVREALEQEPADAAVAYLGDDLTDEDAFRAIGDRGLNVLVRAEKRPSAAHVRLTPPDELLEFLARWERASRRGTEAPASAGPPQGG